MPSKRAGPRIVGAVIGVELVTLAVYSVVFVDWTRAAVMSWICSGVTPRIDPTVVP